METFAARFDGETSFGFESERQMVISAGSKALLFVSSDSGTLPVLSTMAPMKQDPGATSLGMVDRVITGPVDAPASRVLIDFLTSNLSSAVI